MEKEKSPIESVSITLGSQTDNPDKKTINIPPFNILLFAELGYVSKEPEIVSAPEWNEFISSKNVVISGTVNNFLYETNNPIFFEHKIKAISDFSKQSIKANSTPLSNFSKVYFILNQLLDGKTSVNDVISYLNNISLPENEIKFLLSLLTPKENLTQKISGNKSNLSTIDRILSMVDTSLNQSNDLKIFSEDDYKGINKSNIKKYLEDLEKRIASQTNHILTSDFYKQKTNSWQGLFNLIKVIGRKKQVKVIVFSSPITEILENIENILGYCLNKNISPDLVIWDFETGFTTADINSLSLLADASEKYKFVAFVPISQKDSIFGYLNEHNSLFHFFEDVRFLPFKKLRQNTASRNLCLCGPELVNNMGNASWFFATKWAEKILLEQDPFCVNPSSDLTNSIFSFPIFSQTISKEAISDAASFGLTLLDNSKELSDLTKAISVVSKEEVAQHYTSIFYNLFVNRIIRLCGINILLWSQSYSKKEIAEALIEYLINMFGSYKINLTRDQISANVLEDDSVFIKVKSDITVCGYNVYFDFTI
jgi:predicted component of type VI protein secretion system